MEVARGTTSAQSPLQRSGAIGTPRLKGLISRSLTWHLRAVLFVVATAFSGTFAYAEDCLLFYSGSERTDCLSKQILSQNEIERYLYDSINYYYDDLPLITFLIERSADLNSNFFGTTPLMYASRYGTDAIVQLLLSNGGQRTDVEDVEAGKQEGREEL